LVGLSDLPNFLTSQILSGLEEDRLLTKSLKLGLAVHAGPLVEVEHSGKYLGAVVLMIAPKIVDDSSFCVIEHLTPIKFNVSNKFYIGLVRQNNLVLITCPRVKKVIPFEVTKYCFQSKQGFLCHKSIVDSISEINCLGFPWNDKSKLSFPRNHQESSSCECIHPMINLGG